MRKSIQQSKEWGLLKKLVLTIGIRQQHLKEVLKLIWRLYLRQLFIMI